MIAFRRGYEVNQNYVILYSFERIYLDIGHIKWEIQLF